MKNKKVIILVLVVILILIVLAGVFFVVKSKTNVNPVNSVLDENNVETNVIEKEKEEEKPQDKPVSKVDIIDINSNSRPYALVVNNTAVAVKVQEGLNKAYMVYEIPTEGYTSRLLALYKDIDEDLVIGTIRSARHNFIDFALESDAIFCCWGWSHYAQDDLSNGSIDYMQGLFGGPFYRNNPEKLALEHTGYTSMEKLKDEVSNRKFRTTSNNSILLNYNPEDEDLTSSNNAQTANSVEIVYGSAPQIASFKYDENNKMYIRYENGTKCVDHKTKEPVSTKNIIVEKINYKVCSDNYYWDLETIGSGEGYYITNGFAVPITWSKSTRSGKTKYMYKQGTILNGKDVSGKEISVSDGKTWIEVQTNSQKLTIK